MPEKIQFREVQYQEPLAVVSGLNTEVKIYLHSMPGRLESWDAFQVASKAHHIGRILCLTPLSEIHEKSKSYAQAIEQHTLVADIEMLSINDFSVPQDIKAFKQGLDSCQKMIMGTNNHAYEDVYESGTMNNILIHCAAGIGRTGSAAMCLLYQLGIEKELAKACVKAANSGPETQEQQDFVDAYEIKNS